MGGDTDQGWKICVTHDIWTYASAVPTAAAWLCTKCSVCELSARAQCAGSERLRRFDTRLMQRIRPGYCGAAELADFLSDRFRKRYKLVRPIPSI